MHVSWSERGYDLLNAAIKRQAPSLSTEPPHPATLSRPPPPSTEGTARKAPACAKLISLIPSFPPPPRIAKKSLLSQLACAQVPNRRQGRQIKDVEGEGRRGLGGGRERTKSR